MDIRLFLPFAALVPLSIYANDAVSEFNGKLGASYGSLDSSEGFVTDGSIAFPVADALGFQFDGLYADVEDVELYGFGGHFFWRDHEKALLGLSLGSVFGEEVDSYEVSLEGEYYWNWFTLGAKAGFAAIEYNDAVPFIEADKDGAFAMAYATFYPVDDLSVTVSFENRFDNNITRLDAEYALSDSGLTIFAQTMIADHDYDHFLIGLRFYFGGDKSLKQRHREDDPRNAVQDVLAGVASYGAEYNKRANAYAEEERSSVGSGDSGSFSGSGGFGGSEFGFDFTPDIIVLGPEG